MVVADMPLPRSDDPRTGSRSDRHILHHFPEQLSVGAEDEVQKAC
jgi:hypothetical protein